MSRALAEGSDRIVLVGMMGAGKSTVARAVASRLAWPVADVDELVQQRSGKTVAQIFTEVGEAVFRARETRALAEVLGIGGPLVVSVGGGAVLAAANRRLLSGCGLVVWLRAEVATLAARLAAPEGRPLLSADPDPVETLTRLSVERQPLYQEVADATIDVDHLSVSEVADAVVAALHCLPRSEAVDAERPSTREVAGA